LRIKRRYPVQGRSVRLHKGFIPRRGEKSRVTKGSRWPFPARRISLREVRAIFAGKLHVGFVKLRMLAATLVIASVAVAQSEGKRT
jgi:hypothetical protein